MSANDGQAALVSRFLARSDGIFFLGVREMWLRAGRASVAFDVEKPTTEEQVSAWTQALGANEDNLPGMLAAQFNLNLATIQHIAAGELSESANQQVPLSERLWDACRVSARPRLDMLAQRLDLKATWDDLVLPAEEMGMLHQIADQVGQRSKVYEEWGFASKMNRGLGINALFAGESGTGKTMAAEVIANHLRLSLYRIDLSAVVSKYIGETEKNLRRLFDAAEDGGAILFFDEADALFGKRSEVKDSHDRYANIEINYLLQRMEAYRGLAILATNMKSALDTAFTRRLRFIVTFPFPGPGERRLMWQKVFPAGHADPRAGLRPPGASQPDGRQYSQHRSERGVHGRSRWYARYNALAYERGPRRISQDGAARQRGRSEVTASARSEHMNITIHIERLILDGVSVPQRHRPQLQTAIEAELARLLSDGSLAVDLRTPGMLPRLSGGTLELTGDEEPRMLGKQIAQAIYGGIGA